MAKPEPARLRFVATAVETMDSTRVRPLISIESAPFHDALRTGALQLPCCGGCAALRATGFPRCPWCGDPRTTWQAHDGRGQVHSWVRYHRAFMTEYEALVPYAVAAVKLDDGPILFGRVVHGDPVIGRPARAVVERWRDGFCAIAFDVLPETP